MPPWHCDWARLGYPPTAASSRHDNSPSLSGWRGGASCDLKSGPPGAISTFFVKRAKDRAQGVTWRHWLQWTMASAVDRRFILAPTARRGPTNDGAIVRPLVDTARQHGPMGLVLAAAAFDRERSPQDVRPVVQAQRVMPAKRGGATWPLQGMRAQRRQAFPVPLYRQRSLIERVLSAVKRQLSARAPGRSLDMHGLQAVLLGIADTIYRLSLQALTARVRMSTEPDDF